MGSALSADHLHEKQRCTPGVSDGYKRSVRYASDAEIPGVSDHSEGSIFSVITALPEGFITLSSSPASPCWHNKDGRMRKI